LNATQVDGIIILAGMVSSKHTGFQNVDLMPKEDLLSVLTEFGVGVKDATGALEHIGINEHGQVSLQDLVSWLEEGGNDYNDLFSSSHGLMEPSTKTEGELSEALRIVSEIMAMYPSSKRIEEMLMDANLRKTKDRTENDVLLQMARGAMRANALYNAQREDLRRAYSDMHHVLSRSKTKKDDECSELTSQIQRKREALATKFQEGADEATTLMASALERFEALRLKLQERLVPTILRDLELYDAAFAELDHGELTSLLNIGRPIIARATKRLHDIYDDKLRQEPLEGRSTEKGIYGLACLRKVRDEASANSSFSLKMTKQIADESNGKFRKGPMKALERMIEKTEEDNEGDYLKLCDVDRSEIEFESLGSMTKALKAVERLDDEGCLEVVRIKVRLDPTFPARKCSGGYRDILINYRMPKSPHPLNIGELQLHLQKLHSIKEYGGGHETYRVVRRLHMFDPELTSHTGRLDANAAMRVQFGMIMTLNLQGHKIDWELLRTSLQVSTTRVTQLNLSGCGGTNEEVAGIIEALTQGGTPPPLTKLSLAGDGSRKAEYTALPWKLISQLQNLEELDLEHGLLQGPLPDELFQLTNLRQLELSMNPLGIPFPQDLQRLPRLAVLTLRRCQLSGKIPDGFAQACPELKVLILSQNQLEPESVASTLCASANLKYVDLRGLGIIGEFRTRVEAGVPSECRIKWDVGALENGKELMSRQTSGTSATTCIG